MKQLELTEKQKDQLLEMCKTLFPEYIFSFDNTYDDNNILDYARKNKLQDVNFIHWFEFCITHLVNVIWNKIPKYGPNHIYKDLGIKPHVHLKEYLIINCLKSHPVDYLYEQFLKLK